MPEFRTAPTAPVIRIPTLRAVVWEGKVLLELVGSQMVPVDITTDLYISVNGYTSDPDEAQNFASTENVTIESPGAPGKSAYQLWLDNGHDGTYADYEAFNKGPKGDSASALDIQAAVNAYISVNPPADGEDGANATPQQIASAVSAYLLANPPPAGANATPEQIATAVNDWLTANPPANGADGQNATDAQVAQAVNNYLTIHPVANGKSIEIRVDSGLIQTRQTGDVSWTNLLAVSALIGPKGNDGADGKQVELQKTSTAIQWRLAGGTWADLVLLSALIGPQGIRGSLWTSGSGAPTDATAVPNDMYLDTATGDVWQF